MSRDLPIFFALALALAVLAAVLPLGAGPAATDDDCLACHSDKDLKSGQGKPLFVDGARFQLSIHGQGGVGCVGCHADLEKVKDFPHAEKLAVVECAACHEDAAAEIKGSVHGRAHEGPGTFLVSCKDCHGTHDIRGKEDMASSVFAMNIPDTCERCHLERVQGKRGQGFVGTYNDSIHFRVLKKSGLSLSATCATCHGSHGVRPTDDPESKVARKNVIRTCGRCHAGIEKTYLEGVHGKDYAKGSADVPVCTDCHSEHDIEAPESLTSAVYATQVAAVCSRCHDDERLARQYGLITSRLRTYSDSYHGTASGYGETKVANCASCHGFHDVRNSTDPLSSIHPDNMSQTCGRCHAGAGPNFAKGKIHVVSEKTESKGAYFAKIFYMTAIGGLISVFLIFIAVDLTRRARTRWKANKSR